jgi:hypothetical protein
MTWEAKLDSLDNKADVTYRNADVLNLLRCIGVTRVRAKPLHPSVGDTVQEDYGRLDKFRRNGVADW